MQVPVAVSARHIHLSQVDLDVLFGVNYQLNVLRNLSQHGQYAARETVKVVTDKAQFPNVRIVGPVRRKTQLEISRTDAFHLGISVPVRISGDLSNTPGILLVGPKGEVMLQEGVIIAARHLHMSPQVAEEIGVKERQPLTIRLGGIRPTTIEKVHARISPAFHLELHIDTDDANAAGIIGGEWAQIVSIESFRENAFE